MFSEEEVFSIVSRKIEVLKKTKKDATPNFGGVYLDAIRFKNKLKPHYDPEHFPASLFGKRAPNQTEREYNYVKENYKAITYVVWDRFKTTLRRIWNDANWSVTSWGEVDAKYINAGYEPQEYFENEYPRFISLENFYKTVLTDFKEKDPNAVVAHKPDSIPVKKTAEGFMVDDSVVINPIAYIFPCERVIEYFEGQYFIGLSDVTSNVFDGRRTVNHGFIFEFYDDENIYLIKQVGDKKDFEFEIELYWNHNLGYLPCQILKGEPCFEGSDIVYKSHFMPAVEPLDMALLDNSNLLIAKNRHVFPKFWEYQSECNFNNGFGACDNGYLMSEHGSRIKCTNCNGTGMKSMSPMGTYAIPIPDRINPESAGMGIPPAGYIQPEIDTPKFLDEQIDKNISRGLSILNLNVSTTDSKGSETALGKQIDREEMFSFLVQISSQVFHLFEFSLCTIQKMRYGVDATCPTVSYPKNFSIRNEGDLTEEINQAKLSGMPDVAIRQLISEYFKTRFTNNEYANKVIDIVFYSDRLVTLSNLEIAQKLAAGSISKWEDVLHTSISQFIKQAINMDESFIEKTIDEQKAILIQMAKDRVTDITPTRIDTNAIITGANS